MRIAIPTNYTFLSGANITNTPVMAYTLTPSGETYNALENFDNIINSVLFYLSIKQTFYFLIFLVLVQQYNRNSGFLTVGRSLYYVDDP